ncbi:MAG: hypothetical protein ACD_20C00087G0015 [uncultured bacterium]|nr:MAG: hypothetical protein ACD_20C00087G0015 [uncultured bacterium]
MKYSIETQSDIDLDSDKPMLPTSVLVKILNVSQRKLRLYEEKKLLVPTRTQRNRKLYSFNDIEKGKFILFLSKTLGINLIGVKIVLNLLAEAKVLPENYFDFIDKITKS